MGITCGILPRRVSKNWSLAVGKMLVYIELSHEEVTQAYEDLIAGSSSARAERLLKQSEYLPSITMALTHDSEEHQALGAMMVLLLVSYALREHDDVLLATGVTAITDAVRQHPDRFPLKLLALDVRANLFWYGVSEPSQRDHLATYVAQLLLIATNGEASVATTGERILMGRCSGRPWKTISS